MWSRSYIQRVAALVTCVLACGSQSLAQIPDCPAPKPRQQVSGTFTATGQLFRIPLELHPCQDVAIAVTTTDNSPTWGAAFQLQVLNGRGEALDTHDWSTLEPMTKELPLESYGSPYQGASGVQAHPHTAVLRVTNMVVTEVRWSVALVKRARQAHNVGGATFETAPLVPFGTELRGNLHPWETNGQTYKVRLAPGATASVTGTASRLQAAEGLAIVRMSLYDSAFRPLRAETGMVSAPTSPRALPSIAFSNTEAAPALFYVRIRAEGRFINDFRLELTNITENVIDGDRPAETPVKKPLKKPN
jgi:hypothetical protein